MDEATIAITAMSIGVFLVFVSLLIWGIKTNQFKDIEEPKYRMLEDNKTNKRKEE